MAYIGQKPADKPLGASDITDGIISVAKLTSTLDLSSNTVTLPSGVGGKVLQVISSASTTKQSSSSETYADVSGLSASITPSSSSNKVLVIVHVNNVANSGGSATQLKLLRDSTVVTKTTTSGGNATANAFSSGGSQSSNADRINTMPSISFLDSPSSTSSLTYKVQFRTSSSSNTAYVCGWALNDDVAGVATITLMEISA